jgi:hypothetical protein
MGVTYRVLPPKDSPTCEGHSSMAMRLWKHRGSAQKSRTTYVHLMAKNQILSSSRRCDFTCDDSQRTSSSTIARMLGQDDMIRWLRRHIRLDEVFGSYNADAPARPSIPRDWRPR